ncbi:TFIIB-type zinc finger domain-containing protein [Candidatus Saccharibacteria bacterium]|nr:TFIIB-type zinc finger domain-containing protein [Candidatus Saccharibacteria bacterium]
MDKLLEKLRHDFPDLRFRQSRKFAFRPPRTILIGPDEPKKELVLLHEVSHAILKHRDFGTDIERLKMESAAWEKAQELAERYGVEIDEEFIQDELDTYRDWLHKKSRCPECGLTRFQTPDGQYHCPRCNEFLANKK